jgi:uncharacterized membrane protein
MGKSGIVASIAGAVLLASCGSGEKAAAPTAAATTPEPDPVSLSFLPAEFRALGTEPFWNAEVGKGELKWTTPENQSADGVTVPVVRADGAENALFTATIDGQPLQLLVTPGACSDGMSDNVYPWTVERTLGEETVQGCAGPPREREAATAAP